MTDQQKEQEVVSGVVGAIIQKGEKWQVEITPNGSQYAKKPWFTDDDLHDHFTDLYGKPVSVLCNVSHWEMDGKPVRSLWVEQINYDGPAPAARPAEAVSAPQSAPVASRPSDPRGESIERQVAIKAAVRYMALLPEELRSVEEMVAVAERIALFLAKGEGAGPIPF